MAKPPPARASNQAFEETHRTLALVPTPEGLLNSSSTADRLSMAATGHVGSLCRHRWYTSACMGTTLVSLGRGPSLGS